MNTALALQKTIHNNIPLSRYMGYTITLLSDTEIKVTAPLETNINIHGTAFAGSLYSVATLTAWALAYHILQTASSDAHLVLGEGYIRYKAPIKDELLCSTQVSEAEKSKFINTLHEEGRSRLTLKVNINDAAFWEGKLTAIAPKQSN